MFSAAQSNCAAESKRGSTGAMKVAALPVTIADRVGNTELAGTLGYLDAITKLPDRIGGWRSSIWTCT